MPLPLLLLLFIVAYLTTLLLPHSSNRLPLTNHLLYWCLHLSYLAPFLLASQLLATPATHARHRWYVDMMLWGHGARYLWGCLAQVRVRVRVGVGVRVEWLSELPLPYHHHLLYWSCHLSYLGPFLLASRLLATPATYARHRWYVDMLLWGYGVWYLWSCLTRVIGVGRVVDVISGVVAWMKRRGFGRGIRREGGRGGGGGGEGGEEDEEEERVWWRWSWWCVTGLEWMVRRVLWWGAGLPQWVYDRVVGRVTVEDGGRKAGRGRGRGRGR